ncbi:DnaJ C-terminal domain-containing protein [Trinickia sp.]|uniref:DnaJ C-terminal domain-containing protein n=1 Tax=Trinickia sp. TaxID=2571163 RepID=UPI003F801647
MSLDEYYRRLELPGTASPAEVKRAYRRLRAKYHPDRNKGREATVEPAFKRVQEAFEILIGERKAPVAPSHSAPAPAQAREKERAREREKEPETEAPPREPRSRPPMRGANCMTELFVPLETAIHGGEVEANYTVKGPCDRCQGHASNRCPACHGTRIAIHRKSATVAIAAGAWDGQRIVVEGAGHPGSNGGAAGDAILSIAIVCSSAFRRDGLNLACEIQVDFVTAMLGGKLDVPVLGQPRQVTIPPNSQSGDTLRLRGQGLADRNGLRGDLMLQLVLTMPREAAHLTEEDRLSLRDMFARAQRRSS